MKAILIAIMTLTVGAAGALAAEPSGYKILTRIPVTDGGWDYLNYDAANRRIDIGRGTGVTVVDPATNTATLLAGPNVHGAISVDGGKALLTTDGAAGAAHIIDAKTGANIATIPTGRGPDSARLDPHSGLAMVMNHSGGDIALIDVASRKSVGTIAIGGTLEEAVADGTGKAFVNVEDKNEVVAFDIDARKVIAHYPMAGCDGPTGIALAAPEKLLLVACGGAVAVVRADTGALVKTVKIGQGADGIAYDAAHHMAFVPAGRDGNLAILSVSASDVALVDTIPTTRGARTITIDPTSGRLYLMAAQYGAAAAGGRAAVTPGSYQVLVVGK